MIAIVGGVARGEDVDTMGVYAEGFNDLDGLELLRHISEATRARASVK